MKQGRFRLVVSLLVAVALAGCRGAPLKSPTPVPTGVIVISTSDVTSTPTGMPTAAPTPTAINLLTPPAPPRPTARVVATVAEPDGNYVTSSLPNAHYYYYYTDPRWKTVENRVWFHSLDDLLAVYPNRVPAP